MRNLRAILMKYLGVTNICLCFGPTGFYSFNQGTYELMVNKLVGVLKVTIYNLKDVNI